MDVNNRQVEQILLELKQKQLEIVKIIDSALQGGMQLVNDNLRVCIHNENEIPLEYTEPRTPIPDIAKIKKDLEKGVVIDGVSLKNFENE